MTHCSVVYLFAPCALGLRSLVKYPLPESTESVQVPMWWWCLPLLFRAYIYMLQVFDTAEQELATTGQPSSSRGCKYALNTLMQTFQLKPMAANVAAGPV